MTNDERKRVLENLRRIDWKVANILSWTNSTCKELHAEDIAQVIKETVALIEQSGERSEPTTRRKV